MGKRDNLITSAMAPKQQTLTVKLNPVTLDFKLKGNLHHIISAQKVRALREQELTARQIQAAMVNGLGSGITVLIERMLGVPGEPLQLRGEKGKLYESAAAGVNAVGRAGVATGVKRVEGLLARLNVSRAAGSSLSAINEAIEGMGQMYPSTPAAAGVEEEPSRLKKRYKRHKRIKWTDESLDQALGLARDTPPHIKRKIYLERAIGEIQELDGSPRGKRRIIKGVPTPTLIDASTLAGHALPEDAGLASDINLEWRRLVELVEGLNEREDLQLAHAHFVIGLNGALARKPGDYALLASALRELMDTEEPHAIDALLNKLEEIIEREGLNDCDHDELIGRAEDVYARLEDEELGRLKGRFDAPLRYNSGATTGLDRGEEGLSDLPPDVAAAMESFAKARAHIEPDHEDEPQESFTPGFIAAVMDAAPTPEVGYEIIGRIYAAQATETIPSWYQFDTALLMPLPTQVLIETFGVEGVRTMPLWLLDTYRVNLAVELANRTPYDPNDPMHQLKMRVLRGCFIPIAKAAYEIDLNSLREYHDRISTMFTSKEDREDESVRRSVASSLAFTACGDILRALVTMLLSPGGEHDGLLADGVAALDAIGFTLSEDAAAEIAEGTFNILRTKVKVATTSRFGAKPDGLFHERDREWKDEDFLMRKRISWDIAPSVMDGIADLIGALLIERSDGTVGGTGTFPWLDLCEVLFGELFEAPDGVPTYRELFDDEVEMGCRLISCLPEEIVAAGLGIGAGDDASLERHERLIDAATELVDCAHLLVIYDGPWSLKAYDAANDAPVNYDALIDGDDDDLVEAGASGAGFARDLDEAACQLLSALQGIAHGPVIDPKA